MSKRVCLFIVLVVICLLATLDPVPIARAEGTTTLLLYPSDDSWVQYGSTATHGGETKIHVKTNGTTRRSYLKFNLSAISPETPITLAKLYLYCTDAQPTSNVQVDVYETGDGWNEGTIIWGNAPAVGALAASNAAVGGVGQYYSWNITSYAQAQHGGDKILSVVVKFPLDDPGVNEPDYHRDFASKEWDGTDYDPYLEITVDPPHPAATLRVSLPAGTIVGASSDPWLDKGWLLNLTGASGTFTIRVNETDEAQASRDTHLVIALNDAGYNNLLSLTVDSVTIPKAAFQNGTPTPYDAWTWPDCVYPTWFNDTYVNLGTISSKGYKDVNVSVTFSDWVGVKMHFDAYGKRVDGQPTSGEITWSPNSEDSTVLFWLPPAVKYYLTVISPYGTPGGEGWYDNCTYANATLDTGVIDYGNGTRRVFVNWSGDASGTNYSKSDPIHMDQNKTAIANWKTQYQITFNQTGLDNNATGTVVTVNGVEKSFSELPFSMWADDGSSVTYNYSTIVLSTVSGKRFRLDSISSPPSPFTVTGPVTITGNYKTQYYLTVISPYGTPGGEGWYDNCTYANATLDTGVIDYGNGTRRVFVNWSGDASGTNYSKSDPIHMDQNKTAIANWKTECDVTFLTDPAGAGFNITFQSVTYHNGDIDTFNYGTSGSATANVPVGYLFDHWEVTGNVAVSSTTANPTTVTITCGGTLKAVFKIIECNVTFLTDPVGPGFNITFQSVTYHNGDIDTFNYGTSGSATANVPTGYLFDHWEVTGNVGVSSTTANPTTVTVTCGGSLKAVFKLIECNVTFLTNPVGSGFNITFKSVTYSNGQNGTFNYGTSGSATANCPAGYQFDYWEVTGNVDVSSTTTNPTTVTVTCGGTLKVVFKIVKCNVTFLTDPAGPGFNITFQSVTYSNGQNGTFNYSTSDSATANCPAGYQFNNWEVTGNVAVSSTTANPTTVTVTCGGTLKALFKIVKCNVTFLTDPAGPGFNITFQSVTYSNGQNGTFNYSTSGLATASCPANYLFVRWEATGNVGVSSTTANPTTVTITCGGTLKAVFQPILQCNVTFLTDPAGAGFNITFKSVTYSDGDEDTFNYGTSGSATANCPTGYVFVRWEVSGNVDVSSTTANPATVTITCGGTLKAVFSPPSATLIIIDPPSVNQTSPANTTFTVVIKVENITDLYTWVIGLQWDPTVLYCHNVQYMYDWFPGADALLYGKDKGYVETPGAIDNVGGYATPYTMGRRGYTFPNGTTVPSTFKGINGSGPLFNATFSFVSIGSSDINLTGPFAGPPQLINSTVGTITANIHHGYADLNPPPPGPPTASFTQNATFIYVGDWIHFDASGSGPGSNGTHSIPIANYTWNFGDGTGDYVTTSKTIDHQFNVASTPTFNVTLKVTTEDDPILGTWNNTNTTWSIKVVAERPVGCFIDLYTERERFQENSTDITEIGIGYDRPADTYRIDENVTLYAKVTYNDDPLEHRLVSFEVYDANGTLVLVRTDETNKSGIATISFRILTYCPDSEYAYGVWYVMAKTYVCDVKQNDTLRFHVQWIAELQTVTPLAYRSGSWVTTTEIHKKESIGFTIEVWNWALHDKPVVITIVVYDDDGVPIGNYWTGFELPATVFCQPEPDIITFAPAIYIPQWTYVGKGTVYVNCFYELPTECGVATCPEISAQFLIKA